MAKNATKKPVKKKAGKKAEETALPICSSFCSAEKAGHEVAANVCTYISSLGDESGTCGGRGCCIGCDDINKECTEVCSYAINREVQEAGDDNVKKALEAHDIEVMSRKVKTELIEGDSPYNKDLYVYECRFLMQKTAEAMIEMGKRLLVIKEKEGHGNFTKICEEEIGLPVRTASRFMNAAIRTGKYPKIDFGQFGRSGNVYALLEAPEEDLKELEEKGVLAGRDMDALNGMSVKEMRAEIKRLRGDVDKVVREEVKGLAAERKALLNEVQRLSVNDPDGKDIDWSEAQMKAVNEALRGFNDTSRRFVFDDRILEHPELQVKVEGLLAEAEASLRLLKENWENFVCED